MLKGFGPVVSILLRFIIVYVILLGLYQYYLSATATMGLDPYSTMIAEQVNALQNILGTESFLQPDPAHSQIYYGMYERTVTRMVEGCNAISILILFVAFILAFYKGVQTLWYLLIGGSIIYIMNLLRIMALNYVVYFYRSYSEAFHDYIFPSIIYGTVIVLWLVWIQFFVLKNEKN